MREVDEMLTAMKDNLRLRFCRASRHSYFGPICMVCGHDLMRQINGEACSQNCEVCHPPPPAAGGGRDG
jgi:hypothetical protein